MAWFRQRREIAELRKAVAHLQQLIGQQHQAPRFDAGEFLASLMNGQVKQVESMTDFMRMIAEVAAERSANVLGRRGGKKRAASAQRDARGRMLPAKRANGNCELCDDPLASNFSVQTWEEHQKHKNGRRDTAPMLEVEPEPRREPEPEPTRYPLPHVAYRNDDRGADVSGSEGQATTNGVVAANVS